MYLIITWLYSLGKVSGIVPEPKLKNWKIEKLKNWKIEKLKNWIFQKEILYMDSVFQFFNFSVLVPEINRYWCL